MILKSIRLNNFRCFEDTGEIELKPITILVGANSSGKSSFLKFFPLLKNSCKGFGFNWKNSDVDFKNFKNTIKDGNWESTTMGIEYHFVNNSLANNIDKEWFIRQSLQFDKEINKEKIQNIDLLYRNNKTLYQSTTNFEKLTEFRNEVTENLEVSTVKPFNISDCDESYPDVNFELSETMQDRKYLPNFMIDGMSLTEWQKDKNINVKERLSTLQDISDEVDKGFVALSDSIEYIQPIRLDISRDYDIDMFSGDNQKISSDGKNLAFYLLEKSRDKEVMETLNSWLYDNFKIEIRVQTNGNYIEVELSEKKGPYRNIVDLGFGFSQILPILLMVWDSINSEETVNKIIFIEQPEVHMHPGIVARFIALVCKAISYCKDNNLLLRFVIETHSRMILNKLSSLICFEKLEPSNVNILIFDGDGVVRSTYYLEEGNIENWPIGFFDEEEE